ncbi:DUF3613 domain-containing protein [Chromohalobacter sp. TMW 2.2308]|uniref:DUF3613 domain-containing protein n=1 Tax=Chromohalobacter TaxID=42054 RepID=UPI001FFC9DA3|nr:MULTISPECIES: DUF3613 domain-containing protein [Chromohalobacter]MCK2042150.1 DUF3613 domain-containing protein [Chromohalobacter moromii]MCT8514298.1 DUF3613 domain-containing protein [Chromohalobacter sp. TMW 2.2271]
MSITPLMTPDSRGRGQGKRLGRLAMGALGGLALVVLASGENAHAQQDTRQLETKRVHNDLSGHPGQATQRLLEWQRSGRAASSHRQELAGPVQSAIWQRYVESFTHEIPERYIDSDDFGNE